MKAAFLCGLLGLVLLALLLASCGGPAPVTVQPDRVGTQVAEAQAVAETLTAVARSAGAPALLPSAGSAASATPAAPPASQPGPAPSVAQPSASVSVGAAAPACTVQSAGLRMRSGPGTVYEPPVGSLAAGTGLEPLAFTAKGFPDGQWLQVRVAGTGQVGWVSAAPQLVTCSVRLTSLPGGVAPPTPAAPVAVVPPTPTPTSTPAPIAYVNVPVAGENGDLKGDVVVLAAIVAGQNPLAFHDRVAIQVRVRDTKAKENKDGAGIASVEFSITGPDGDEVQHQVEKNAAYCSFGNSGPACDEWVFKDHGNKWPKGQAAKPGKYRVFISIQPTDSSHRAADWNFEFDLK